MTDTTPRTNQQIGEDLKPLADTIRSTIRTKFILGDPIDFLVADLTVAVARQLGSLVREDNDELRRLRAVEAAARAFADEMGDYCSPHGVAADYAQRLHKRLDQAATIQPNQL
jgi:hypothetical protein